MNLPNFIYSNLLIFCSNIDLAFEKFKSWLIFVSKPNLAKSWLTFTFLYFYIFLITLDQAVGALILSITMLRWIFCTIFARCCIRILNHCYSKCCESLNTVPKKDVISNQKSADFPDNDQIYKKFSQLNNLKYI